MRGGFALIPLVALGEVQLEALRLPEGFEISLFAEHVENARQMALGDQGTVFVGTLSAGKVYALRDTDGDGRADKVYTLATGLHMPNGVAFWKGDLYVAEVERILRFPDIEARLDHPPQPEVVYDRFPSHEWHGWKYIRFGPDGKLYSQIGAPCNVCEPKEPFATLVRLDPDGNRFEIFARGIRSVVGFDWHPETGTLWFNDNGRDWLGDDLPPDELNHAPGPGYHFGFPYCFGRNVADPYFGKKRSCREFTPPEWEYPAHVAPLGMRFYRGTQFPEKYRGQLFVAQHGSWNRSEPIGYRVVWIRFKGGKPVAEHPFVTGWLRPDGKAWGRPVDILELPDGSLLISDDRAGAIYRVTYRRSTGGDSDR